MFVGDIVIVGHWGLLDILPTTRNNNRHSRLGVKGLIESEQSVQRERDRECESER